MKGSQNNSEKNASHRRSPTGPATAPAVLIVITMPDSNEPTKPEKASMPADREPFELADGNTYVEHAGKAIEVDRIRSFNAAL